MGFNVNSLKVNRTREQDGVWVNYVTGKEVQPHEVEAPVNKDLLFVKVRRVGNPDYEKYVGSVTTKSLTRRRGQVSLGDLETMRDTQKDAIAKHVLMGWRNLCDSEGNEISFSAERARKLFDEAPEFYLDVIEIASNFQMFAMQQVEAAVGN